MRDYKKYKKIVMSQEFEIEKYCILAIGQKDEHAEMRLLGFLLNQDKILSPSENQSKLVMENPVYLGISKLCCPYCNTTLNVFNKSLLLPNETEVTTSQNVSGIVPQIGDEDDEVISSEHLSEKAVSVLIQMGHDNSLDDAALEVRGAHDLRFKWSFPAFARHIDGTDNWKCEKIAKVKDVTPDKKNVGKNIIYYEETKSHMRCALVQNASISKEAKKNIFNISPCVVEFTLNEESIQENQVNIEHFSVASTAYYCPGFRSQMEVISLSYDGKNVLEEWIDLESSSCEKTNLKCLQNAGFHVKLVTAFEAVNSKVVDTSGQIRMVASTSSSSVDDRKLIKGGNDLALASLLPEEPEISDESQHAEESAGDSYEHGSPASKGDKSM